MESILRYIAVLLLAVASFPAAWTPAGPGTDFSFKWALNQGADLGLVHGRDLFFNYGPLGWIAFPMDIGSNLLRGQAAQMGVWLMVCCELAILLARRRRLAVTAALVAGYLAALQFAILFEYRLLFGLALLFTISLEISQRRSALLGVGGGALAAATLFIKFSSGVVAMMLLAMYEFALFSTTKPRRWLPLLAAPAAAVAVILSMVALHFGSVATFGRWLSMSAEVASGYNSAMSLSGRAIQLYLAQISIVAAVASLAAFRLPADRCGAFPVLLLLVPLVLAYRHGFVRQASHSGLYFIFALTVAGALPLAMRTDRARRVGYLAAATVAGLAVAGLALGPGFPAAALLAGEPAREGLRQMSRLVHLSRTREGLARASSEAIAVNRLPGSWVERLKSGRTDVVPYETSIIPANGLVWSPNPVVQTYNAYTRPLDTLSAAYFAGAGGPSFVVLHLSTIDLRHPLLDAPATAQALLRHYRPLAVDEPQGRILLGRSERAVGDLEPPASSRGALRLGEWVQVPRGDGLQFMSADFRLTAAGRLQRLLLKVPAVAMEVEYDDGRVVPIRILPETAAGGLLLSHVPSTAGAVADLFAGRPTDRVRRFRIGGVGAELYEIEVPTEWWTEPVSGEGAGDAP